MEKKKQECTRIKIDWDLDTQYHFIVEAEKSSRNNKNKRVYLGYFEDDAPVGLRLDDRYCLVRVHINKSDADGDDEEAFTRNQYDLLDFSGNYFRTILARNPNAEMVARSVQKDTTIPYDCDCYYVMPRYLPSGPLFRSAECLTVNGKLELLRQMILGADDLQKKMIGAYNCRAHRDLKPENIMLQNVKNGFEVKIIDFATVRLMKRESAEWDVSKHDTMANFTSASNTAPEYLKESYGPVSEKSDVYAIGLMGMSLFATCNGKHEQLQEVLFEHVSKTVDKGEARISMIQVWFIRRYEKYRALQNPDYQSWIEQELEEQGEQVCWDADTPNSIRQILRKSVFLQADARPTLQEFLKEVERCQRTIDNPKLFISDFKQTLSGCEKSGEEAGNRFSQEEAQSPFSVMVFERGDQTSMREFCRGMQILRSRGCMWQGNECALTARNLCFTCAGINAKLETSRLVETPQALDQFIRQIPTDDRSACRQVRLMANLAKEIPKIMQDVSGFTGTVHVFLPGKIDCSIFTPIANENGKKMDLEKVLTHFRRKMGKDLQIVYHVLEQPDFSMPEHCTVECILQERKEWKKPEDRGEEQLYYIDFYGKEVMLP